MLKHVSDHASEYRTQYGNVSAASIGAIQRQLLTLENEGAEKFFGEPSLNLQDWMQTDNGKGIINILNSEKLMRSPRMYSAFLLWMLAELFETLPEVGDLDKPKFVMFFDEAHLMFDNAANALVEQIEQVVRLIRSKGVGVYFVTQNPLDLPDTILGHWVTEYNTPCAPSHHATKKQSKPLPKPSAATQISKLPKRLPNSASAKPRFLP